MNFVKKIEKLESERAQEFLFSYEEVVYYKEKQRTVGALFLGESAYRYLKYE